MTEPPSIEVLRAVAAQQGIHPQEVDLEAVRGFLAVLLPQLAALEAKVSVETVPAGLPLPVDEAGR